MFFLSLFSKSFAHRHKWFSRKGIRGTYPLCQRNLIFSIRMAFSKLILFLKKHSLYDLNDFK